MVANLSIAVCNGVVRPVTATHRFITERGCVSSLASAMRSIAWAKQGFSHMSLGMKLFQWAAGGGGVSHAQSLFAKRNESNECSARAVLLVDIYWKYLMSYLFVFETADDALISDAGLGRIGVSGVMWLCGFWIAATKWRSYIAGPLPPAGLGRFGVR